MTSRHLPASARPIMVQRFRVAHTNPDVWPAGISAAPEGKPGMLRWLWFSNGILYIPLGKHRQKAAEQMRCAEELRAAGIIPSIQIQATMGHSDAFCTPDTLKTMTWGAYVGRNGKQCRYCSCTRQEDFLEYFREVARRWIFTLVAYEPRNIVKQVNSSIFVTFEAFFNVLIQYISRE